MAKCLSEKNNMIFSMQDILWGSLWGSGPPGCQTTNKTHLTSALLPAYNAFHIQEDGCERPANERSVVAFNHRLTLWEEMDETADMKNTKTRIYIWCNFFYHHHHQQKHIIRESVEVILFLKKSLNCFYLLKLNSNNISLCYVSSQSPACSDSCSYLHSVPALSSKPCSISSYPK